MGTRGRRSGRVRGFSESWPGRTVGMCSCPVPGEQRVPSPHGSTPSSNAEISVLTGRAGRGWDTALGGDEQGDAARPGKGRRALPGPWRSLRLPPQRGLSPGTESQPFLPGAPRPPGPGGDSVALVAHCHQQQPPRTESTLGPALPVPTRVLGACGGPAVTAPSPASCSSSGWSAGPASYPASSGAGPSWLGPGTCPWPHCRSTGPLPG